MDDPPPAPLALPPPKPADLSSLIASVFVREPNGSRTNIEHHLEQELILRHARVVVANQKIGNALIKDGEFKPLAIGVNCSFVGTLVNRKGIKIRSNGGPWVDGEIYSLSFRLFGSDGSVLISGTAEKGLRLDAASLDEAMRCLAVQAIAYLDTTDVWLKVVIT